MTRSLFVSHHGDDLNDCTNGSVPCRTVRHTVKISNEGDHIYIDYSDGRPYMECENVTYSTCSIHLTKSISFHGVNGKAEIRCWKRCNFFIITSQELNVTRVKFVNLAISNSNTVARLEDGTRSELVFQNMLIGDSLTAIYSKRSNLCSIMILDSSFEDVGKFQWGIYLRCLNLTAHIISSVFKKTPVYVTNCANKKTPWTKTEIFVRNTTFTNENVPTKAQMFAIKPFVAILNITMIDSEFRNHALFSSVKHGIGASALQVYDDHSSVRNITFMMFSNLVFKNNYNNWAALSLIIGYREDTEVNVMIRESVFRNNSLALRVSSHCFCSYSPSIKKVPTIILEKNTFVQNFYDMLRTNGAAAIYFQDVKGRVLSCRFLDNKPGQNPYTGVVTNSRGAKVTFLNCLFENRQTAEQANQMFSSAGLSLNFYGKNTFNLAALKESQTVFARILTNIDNGVTTKKHFEILCPRGYMLNTQRQCENLKRAYKCRYIIVKCEQCPRKTYTVERGKFIFNESNDIQCQQCPRGGECEGGLVHAKPNFWGHKTEMTKVVFSQCLPGYCCQSKNCGTYGSCHGNRSGTLCGQCQEGMSESLFSTQCVSNKECSLNYFFVLGTIAALVFYLIFFLYHKEIVRFIRRRLISKRLSFPRTSNHEQRDNVRAGGNNSSPSGIIKIFFYYYQVCNLIRSSLGSSKNGQFIQHFENAISRVMDMILVNLPSFNCPFKDLRAVPKTVIVHSVGYCLLGLLCLLYLTSKLFLILRRTRNDGDRETALQSMAVNSIHRSHALKPSFSQRVASAFTYISLLMYTSSAKFCLSFLHCVPVGDSQVLLLDGSIKCYQTFQYFLLAYLISSILPFCLIPVLGSYLLKFRRIGVKQFCAACIFPLPFCCFWLYMLLKGCRPEHQRMNSGMEENINVVRSEQHPNDTHANATATEEISDGAGEHGTTSNSSELAILGVLLGPFRCHKEFMCFPSSHIPWEGFLIFRRLILVIVLTFVYDIQLRLFLALILCVGILIVHMFVNPFQRKCENVLECFSLGTHVIFCGSTLIKALYYGEDYSSLSNNLRILNVIENIFIIAPLSIIITVVVISIIIKLVFGIKLCVSVLIRKIGRFFRLIM